MLRDLLCGMEAVCGQFKSLSGKGIGTAFKEITSSDEKIWASGSNRINGGSAVSFHNA